MHRFVIAAMFALPGLLYGGVILAGCGCGCGSQSRSRPMFGPGSYRVWDRQNNCWLYYDAATKGTYFWSPVEQRYQLIAGAVATAPGGVPSGDGHQHQRGSAAVAAPGGSGPCPNCAARPSATPGALPAMPVPIAVSTASPGGTGDGHQDHQHDHAVAPAPAVSNPGSIELLPPPQQAAAPYGGQKLCPVTDDELGSMGAPIPVTVRGQTIWVCCRGCVAKLQRDPDKYLRKVASERNGQQPKRP